MSLSKLVGSIQSRLADAVLAVKERSPRRMWVTVRPERIREVARYLFEDAGGRLATISGVDGRDETDLLYHFCFDQLEGVVTVRTSAAKPTPEIDSVATLVEGANWIEREIHDLLGVKFRGHPDMRRLILADDWPEGVYPLRCDFRKEELPEYGAQQPVPPSRSGRPREQGVAGTAHRILLPIGPYHPLQEEAEFFQLTIEGERVVDMDMRTSYNHRGIEQLSTTKTFDQVPFVVERVCGICSASHPLAYVQAVEELAGIEVPERALYLRTIVNELERIHSHMLWVGLAGHFLGYNTVWMWTWRYREPVLDLLEVMTGSRINYANARVGGVRREISNDLWPLVNEKLDEVAAGLDLITKAVLDDPVLHARLKGVGVLSKEDAIRFCATGPTARGSGVPIDVRRDDPYAAYDRVDWEVIVQEEGDVFAKAVVRLLECFEAIKIIRQCTKEIPDGPLSAEVREIPPGEGIGRVEAPRGETFHYVKSDGSNFPVRHKIRAPSFVNVPSFKASCIGELVADVAITLASVDPCYSCTERVAVVRDRNRPEQKFGLDELIRLSQERTAELRRQLGA